MDTIRVKAFADVDLEGYEGYLVKKTGTDERIALAASPQDDILGVLYSIESGIGGECLVDVQGLSRMVFAGAVQPFDKLTAASTGKGTVASNADNVIGRFIPEAAAQATDLPAGTSTGNYRVYLNGVAPASGSGVVVGYHDFATDGGAISAITMRDASTLSGSSVVLPAGAVISYAHIIVDTTYTSATDAATIALNIGGIDLRAAVAISTGTSWDAGDQACIQTGSAANTGETTTAAALIATVAVEAVTAGAMRVFVHYTIAAAE